MAKGGVPSVAPGFLTQAMIQRKAAERLEEQIAAEKDLATTKGLFGLGGTLLGGGLTMGTSALTQHMKGEQTLDQLGRPITPEVGREEAFRLAGASQMDAPPTQQAAKSKVEAAAAVPDEVPSIDVPPQADAERTRLDDKAAKMMPTRTAIISHSAQPRTTGDPLGGLGAALVPEQRKPRGWVPAARERLARRETAEGETTAVGVGPWGDLSEYYRAPPPQPPPEVMGGPKVKKGAGVVDTDGTFIPERVFKVMYPDTEQRTKQRFRLSLSAARNAKTDYYRALARDLEHKQGMNEASHLLKISDLELNWRKHGLTVDDAKNQAWLRVTRMVKNTGVIPRGKWRIVPQLQLKYAIEDDRSSDWYGGPRIVGMTPAEVREFPSARRGRITRGDDNDVLFSVPVGPYRKARGGREIQPREKITVHHLQDAIDEGLTGEGAIFKSQREIDVANEILDHHIRGNEAKVRQLLRKSPIKTRMRSYARGLSGKGTGIPPEKGEKKETAKSFLKTVLGTYKSSYDRAIKTKVGDDYFNLEGKKAKENARDARAERSFRSKVEDHWSLLSDEEKNKLLKGKSAKTYLAELVGRYTTASKKQQ